MTRVVEKETLIIQVIMGRNLDLIIRIRSSRQIKLVLGFPINPR